MLKGLTTDDFLGAMGVMSAAVGFDCSDCHNNAGTNKVNWAAVHAWPPADTQCQHPTFWSAAKQSGIESALRAEEAILAGSTSERSASHGCRGRQVCPKNVHRGSPIKSAPGNVG